MGGDRVRVAIGFYHLPADQAALRKFLLNTGPVCARRHQSVPDPQEPEFGSLAEVLTQDGGVFLICRRCDIGDVPIERYQSGGTWWRHVDPQVAAVLTYSYEPLGRRELFRSSLGASLDYVAAGERRQKGLGFKRWAKSVVAWVRARCTATCTLKGFAYPCTPAVAAALKEGKIVLSN